MRPPRKYKRPPSRFMKLLTGLAVALVGLSAATIIIPGFIDWNRFKGEFERQASALTGREVRVAGGIEFTLLPRPALSLENVTLASIEGTAQPNLLSLQQFESRLGVLPLLSGKIQITQFRLVGPVLNLEILPDGRNNWTLQTDTSAQPGIRFDQILIEGGDVHYYNAVSGYDMQITALDLQLAADSLQGPFKAQGALQLHAVPVTFDVTLGMLSEQRPAPVNLKTQVGNGAKINFAGTLSSAAKVTGILAGEGEDLSGLISAAAQMRKTSLPENRWTILKRAYRMESSITGDYNNLVFDRMRLTLGENTVTGRIAIDARETPNIDVTLTASTLDLDVLRPAPAGEEASPADSIGVQEQEFEVPRGLGGHLSFAAASVKLNNGNIRDVDFAMALADGAIRIEKLDAQLPGSTAVQISGDLRAEQGAPQLTGLLNLKSENLRGLIGWLGMDFPAMAERRLARGAIVAQYAVSENLVEFTAIDAELDSSKVAGSIGVSLGERLAAGLDLKIDQLNVDSYFPQEASAPADPATEDTGASPAYLGDAFAYLNRFDCDFKLAVAALTYRGAPITELQAEGAFAGGTLILTRLALANIAGTALSMSGLLSKPGGAPEGEVNFRLASHDLSGFARTIGMPLPVAGAQLGLTTIEAKLLLAAAGLEATIDSRIGETSFLVTGTINGLAPGIVAPVGTPLSGTAHLVLVSPGLTEFSRRFGIPLSPAPPEDAAGINLNADLTFRPHEIDLNALNGAVGTVPVQGQLAWRNDGPKPVFKGRFSTGEILADNFLQRPPVVRGAAAQTSGSGQLPWSGEPLDLELIDRIEAAINLDATRFSFNGYDLFRPSLVLTVHEGKADLKQFAATLWGGAATATAGLHSTAGAPEFSADWKLQGADLQMAATALQDDPAITGRLDVAGSVRGAGASTFALIASLEGQARFTATDGIIEGIDLDEFSQRLGSLNKTADFFRLAGSVLQQGQTPYQQIDLPFTIREGIAQVTGPVIAITAVSSSLRASIDLPRYWLNAEAEFVLDDHPDAPPLGIAFIGPLNNPERTLRTEKLENFFTARLLSESLQRVINKNAAPPAAGEQASPSGEIPSAPPQQTDPQPGNNSAGDVLKNIFKGIVGDKKQ